MTAVQVRAKCGGIKPDLATSRPEATPKTRRTADRRAQDHREKDVKRAWSIGYAIGKITKGKVKPERVVNEKRLSRGETYP